MEIIKQRSKFQSVQTDRPNNFPNFKIQIKISMVKENPEIIMLLEILIGISGKAMMK
jgi:hypothetical protein